MALNVRFMQKAGIEPAQAVTGMGLNVLAGGIVHASCLFVFVAWAGQSSTGFKIPASSKLLVIIAVVLAIVGIVVADAMGTSADPDARAAFLEAIVVEPGGACPVRH